MLQIDIPGVGLITLNHLVSDFNGTLSLDGKLPPAVKKLLNRIAKILIVHILTADTFGKVKAELNGVDCELRIFKGEGLDVQKEEYVKTLGARSVVVFGNGKNDKRMLRNARIGIVVAGGEGCSVEALMAADIQVKSIQDAFGLLLNPDRCKATLRT